MRRILFVLIPLILLFAAGLSVLRMSSASGAVPVEAAVVLPTATPSPTLKPTATAAPTATPEPTATATPTPTPVTLPVTNGTPVPNLPYEVITTENVHRLREIARYGYPRLLDTAPYRLTADGRTIVVGTTLGLEFYDAQTQTKSGGFEVEFLRDYDLTPDGQYLLTFAGGNLTVWTRDGQKVREFDLQAGDAWTLKAVALSADGALLAVQRPRGQVVEADKLDVYRVADGALLDTVRGMGAVFSPDGQYLATVFDGAVRLYPVAELGQGWEKRLPKQTLPWCGDVNEGCGLVFSPDGTLAAVVRAARVDVYQVAERKLIRQVSGWEVRDTYYLPQVQFAEGKLLITTLPLYDRQGNVQTPAQAIVVDITSGEWVSQSEAQDGFAYLSKGQVQTFRWKAEGEMPMMYHYKISAQIDTDNRLDLYVLGYELGFGIVHCIYQNCDFQSFDLPIKEIPVYDENLEKYTLQFSPRWALVHEEKTIPLQYSGHSFAVPNAKIVVGLLIVWAAESPQSSEIAVFDKLTGKLLYRVAGFDFYSWGEKVYLFSQDGYAEISDGKLQKHKSLEGCSGMSRTAIALCTIFNGFCPELDTANMLDFVFIKGRFLVANYSDGFIRVWAVVPENVQ